MRIAAALALGWSLAAAPQPAVKPNLVFILADDLGWGDLGVYSGSGASTSPVTC